MKKVTLPNFGLTEGDCKCGCGMKPDDNLLLTMQGFIFILSRVYGRVFRYLPSSIARCKEHNKDEGGSDDSRHVHGDAADGIFQFRNGEETWTQLDNKIVAVKAFRSGMFGGIGHEKYVVQGKNLVHLDTRPGSIPILW